ncbi:hypothetical protein DL96DRAFT_994867 [Flagelloscypha sp. PMI_526]|nr:hypothetical protein DL96DRAFT_994867 [Flagelloscypha sp. PMI_526]
MKLLLDSSEQCILWQLDESFFISAKSLRTPLSISKLWEVICKDVKFGNLIRLRDSYQHPSHALPLTFIQASGVRFSAIYMVILKKIRKTHEFVFLVIHLLGFLGTNAEFLPLRYRHLGCDHRQ